MNCFKHNDRSAVGICKACAKGVCPECAAELTNGIACKDACEARVQLLNQMIDNNSKTMSAARFQTASSGKVSLIFGGALLFFAAWWYVRYQDLLMPAFFGVFGVIIVINGIQRLSRRAQYPSIESKCADR